MGALLYIHSPVDGHMAYLQLLPLVNNADMNIQVLSLFVDIQFFCWIDI